MHIAQNTNRMYNSKQGMSVDNSNGAGNTGNGGDGFKKNMSLISSSFVSGMAGDQLGKIMEAKKRFRPLIM